MPYRPPALVKGVMNRIRCSGDRRMLRIRFLRQGVSPAGEHQAWQSCLFRHPGRKRREPETGSLLFYWMRHGFVIGGKRPPMRQSGRYNAHQAGAVIPDHPPSPRPARLPHPAGVLPVSSPGRPQPVSAGIPSRAPASFPSPARAHAAATAGTPAGGMPSGRAGAKRSIKAIDFHVRLSYCFLHYCRF